MRKVIVVILLAILAGYWFAYGHLPGLPAAGQNNSLSGTKYYTLRKSYALDLESGSVQVAKDIKRDLWWQMVSPTEQCLCPFPNSHAALAPLPQDAYGYIGAAGLAKLDYSTRGFRNTNRSRGVYPGLALAVRTGEGDYAKVRVDKIVMDDRLQLEWQLFRPVDEFSNVAVLRDEVRTAGRYVRYQLGRFSIMELAGMAVCIVLLALVLFILIFGRRLSSKEFWQRELEVALNNNATHFRVQAGKPLQVKIDGEWKESRFPIEPHEFNRLQMFVDQHAREWLMPGAGIASVIRNDADHIEWELNPNKNV